MARESEEGGADDGTGGHELQLGATAASPAVRGRPHSATAAAWLQFGHFFLFLPPLAPFPPPPPFPPLLKVLFGLTVLLLQGVGCVEP